MKKLLAFALSLAIFSPAFAQKNNLDDKPKDTKKEAKKYTLTIGFAFGSGPFIKLQIKTDGKKAKREADALIGAITGACLDAPKPKKMVQVHHMIVGAQTAPSAFYLQDDVQYSPPTTETPLPNARRVHQKNNLSQPSKQKKMVQKKYVVLPAPKSSPNTCESIFHSSEYLQKIWSDMWNEDGIVSGTKVPFRIENEQPKKLLEFHHIITPTPMPLMPQIVKPAMATAAAKTAPACPLCQKAASLKIQKVNFVKEALAGVIVIQTKITETDNAGKKNVIAAPKMMTKLGQKASMEIVGAKDGIKLEIVAHPLTNHPGHIVIKLVLHKMNKDGKMKVVAKPTIMTKTGIPAKVMVGTKHHSNIEMEIVAKHIFSNPPPPKAMLRMTAPNMVFRTTQMTMPRLPMPMMAAPQTAAMMNPATKFNMVPHIVKQNQMCESCKTTAMAKCACCGKPMAATATLPNIMQAGFARVNSNEMTVKVYPFAKYFEGPLLGLEGLLDDADGFEFMQKTIDSLMKAVQNSVEPDSWKAVGGEATIDFTLIGMSLIVRQNKKAHSEIEKIMTDLGKAIDSGDESKEK